MKLAQPGRFAQQEQTPANDVANCREAGTTFIPQTLTRHAAQKL